VRTNEELALLVPRERLSYVLPKKDFGLMFTSSLGTHIIFKKCPMVSAHRGAGSCDAESGLVW